MYHQKMSYGAAFLFSVLLITILSSINIVDAGRSPAAMKKTATLTPELFLDSDQVLGIEVTMRDDGPGLGGPLLAATLPGAAAAEAAKKAAEAAATAKATTEAAVKATAEAAAAAAEATKKAAEAATKGTPDAAAAAAAAAAASEAAAKKAAEATATAKEAAETAAKEAAAAAKEAAEAAAKEAADAVAAAAAAAAAAKEAAAVKEMVESTNTLLKQIPKTDEATLTKLGKIDGLAVDNESHFVIITQGKTNDQIKETIRQVNAVLNP